MMNLIYLVLFSFLISPLLQAEHLQERESNSQHSTSLIPKGHRVTKDDKRFAYMRQILSDKGSCSAFDIGCNFLLTAGHCSTENGKITLGIDDSNEVGVVEKSFTPVPKEPKNLDDFVNGEWAKNDIRLVKVKYDSGIPKPPASTTLIDWNTKPLQITADKEIKGLIVGSGASEARWNEEKKAWEPSGPSGILAWGKLTLDSVTYEEGKGRICSKGKEGNHGIICGDSGGPLLGPDGHLRGINSSFTHGSKKAGYESCFTDIAGHLNWIYKIMDKEGCKTIPPNAPPEPKLMAGPTPHHQEKVLGHEAKHFQTLLSYLNPHSHEAATFSLRAKLLEDAYVRNAPKLKEEERKTQLAEIEKARNIAKEREQNFQRLYPGKDKTQLNMDAVSTADKERLRRSLGDILQIDFRKQKVIFLGPILFTKEGVKVTYGFCPLETPIPDCPSNFEGTAMVKGTGISLSPKSGQGRTIPYR